MFPERFEALLLRLLEAWEMADADNGVYWDFGPGELPQKIAAKLLLVARRTDIPVVTKRMADGPEFIFDSSKDDPKKVRVRSSSD